MSYTSASDIPKWNLILRRIIFFTVLSPFIIVLGIVGVFVLGMLHALCWAFPKEIEAIIGSTSGK